MNYSLPRIYSVLMIIAVCHSLLYADAADSKKTYSIAIITSVYDGDAFIVGFMKDIVQQTIFSECELILINPNSPGHEELIIKPYLDSYPNIKYIKLPQDPGIYAVWNIAIKSTSAPFITNANVDDRIAIDSCAVHKKALEQNPHLDLVYSDMYVTRIPNETFATTASKRQYGLPEFSKKNMRVCIMGNHPMWRKSMHDKYGYFDESYKSAGDFEMWLRAVRGGAQFKKIPGIYGLYYSNPNGLSTRPNSANRKEYARIITQYQSMFK